MKGVRKTAVYLILGTDNTDFTVSAMLVQSNREIRVIRA